MLHVLASSDETYFDEENDIYYDQVELGCQWVVVILWSFLDTQSVSCFV